MIIRSRTQLELEGMKMKQVRQAVVAGQFYPRDEQRLRAAVEGYIGAPVGDPGPGEAPSASATLKAIIVPHAGYVYSGPVAGTAYAALAKSAAEIRRVVLIGPAHWIPVQGLAASSAEAFVTPLGVVPLDHEALQLALSLPQVRAVDEAHTPEHCLEVQLPFLQTILYDFRLAPFLVADAGPDEVAELLELLWGGPETLVVISSDLSHYYDYETASALDRATSQKIEALLLLDDGQACGRSAINGLLQVARNRGLRVETADLRSSGDTGGRHDRVVGYGAFLFWEGGRQESA
jgi:AmmeMemoRadiSam system protein B